MPEQSPLTIADKQNAPAIRLWAKSGFRRDAWRHVDDDVALPTGFAIISLQRWRSEKSALAANPATSIGLRLEPTDILDLDQDEIGHIDLIVLKFPKFTDGRAYSTARRLREQLKYAGELRATGDVLFDQLPLMLRCGFDSFEIADAATIRAIERAGATRMRRIYQAPTLQGDMARRPHPQSGLVAAE